MMKNHLNKSKKASLKAQQGTQQTYQMERIGKKLMAFVSKFSMLNVCRAPIYAFAYSPCSENTQ